MSKRPDLYTSYKTETSIFPTPFQKFWFALLVIFSFAIPFILSNYWILLITTSLLIAIASWGLNIVSGYAGQVNLGHGVFVGIGTYVSSVLGGVATTSVIGYELDMVIWLPLSGLAATLIGIILSPVSARLKGLNLGLVTLALVFIGSHFFSNLKFIYDFQIYGLLNIQITSFLNHCSTKVRSNYFSFGKMHFFGLSFSLSHISMLPPRDVSITKSACPKTDYFDFSERNMCFWGLFVRPFASPRRLPPPSYRRSRVDTMPTPSVGHPRT